MTAGETEADSGADSEDGRRARRQRNRQAVVDAILALYAEGNLDPNSDEISARAGLSPRSLFRYFDDVDDLCRSAIATRERELRPLAELAIDPSAPFATRIDALVTQRVALFEAMGSAGQVARLRAPFQPLIAEQLAQVRAFLRGQLARIMAPELARLGPEPAARLVAAADVLASFEGYRLLRDDQSLARADAHSVLADALTRLFDPEHP